MEESYPSRTRYKKRKSNWKTWAIRIGMALFIVMILFSGALAVTSVALVRDAPALQAEKLIALQASTIYDMNGEKVMDIAGEEYRKTIPLEEIPKEVQNAFLAVEDARFWSHPGIDVKRIAGAVVVNLTEGFGAEGASTITQQLVKLSFLSPEKTIKRKVQEMYLALKLERKYSKEEILEMYLNKVYFGEGTYGVATAAETFFQKSVDELTISEAALLAGLPQRPTAYNPFENPELAEQRRNTVLALMEEQGFISEQEKEEAQSLAVEEMLNRQVQETKYRTFIDHVIEELVERGIDETEIYTRGLKIYTTLDPDAQEITEKVLTSDEYIQYPNKPFRAGVALIDTQTGEIRALGGKRDAEDEEIKRGFNYATQLKRQPGSTAKPFMAYGPAIEHLKWPTNHIIRDEEIVLNGKVFRNWDNRFHGNVTMRTALQWSYNIPAIKTMQEVGPEKAKKFAANLGIELENVYPAYAIGGFSEGVSPLELAGAYAAFGNNGVFHEPYAVTKVVYPDGEEKQFRSESVQAMSDYTAYMITDMLKSVVTQGTGQLANIPGLPLAGKTGTNQLPDHVSGSGAADAWFVGYTTLYSASVWIGFDEVTQEHYLSSSDTRLARMIFREIMSRVSEGKDTPDFEMPSSVVERNGELYVKGSQPSQPLFEQKEDLEETDEQPQQVEEENWVDEQQEVEQEVEEELQQSEREEEQPPRDQEIEREENRPPTQEEPEQPEEDEPDEENELPENNNVNNEGVRNRLEQSTRESME